MSDQKHREFWIQIHSEYHNMDMICHSATEVEQSTPREQVHVIEKSAYDQVNELLAGNMCGYCDRKMHEQDGFDLHKEIIRGDELFQMAQKLRADLDLANEAVKQTLKHLDNPHTSRIDALCLIRRDVEDYLAALDEEKSK